MQAKVTHITLGGTLPRIFSQDPARQHIDITKPTSHLVGWSAHGRGNTLWLVSPPGWTEDTPRPGAEPASRAVFRFPMTSVVVRWSAAGFDRVFDATLDKFDTPPFGPGALEAHVVPVGPAEPPPGDKRPGVAK